MRYITDELADAYEKLLEIAGGSSLLVEQALAELNRPGAAAPSLEDVANRIIELRAERERERRIAAYAEARS